MFGWLDDRKIIFKRQCSGVYLFDLLLQKILNFTPQRSNGGQLFITWPVLGVNYADFRVKDHSKVDPGVNSGSL